MRRRALALLFGAAALGVLERASAMWVALSDAELIAQSDAIVLGALTGSEPVAGQVLGRIEVRAVLKGAAAARVVHLAMAPAGVARSGSDIRYQAGQDGLWFLRLRNPAEPGIYLADHPQRFVPAARAQAQADAVRQALRP